eukprot:scaffold1954_cov268-Pinguiococcus_pyrenoidosus.AAC.51
MPTPKGPVGAPKRWEPEVHGQTQEAACLAGLSASSAGLDLDHLHLRLAPLLPSIRIGANRCPLLAAS